MGTYHVRAHVPVSRECTKDTERFFHFQNLKSSCLTTLGTGSLCRSLWTTLKTSEQTSTERPGRLFSTGSRASILPPSHPLSPGAGCFSSSSPSVGLVPLLSPSPRICSVQDGMFSSPEVCRERRLQEQLQEDEPGFVFRKLSGVLSAELMF